MNINIDEYKFIGVIDDGKTILLEKKETNEIVGIPTSPVVLEAFDVNSNGTEEPSLPSSFAVTTNTNNKSWCDNATRILIHKYKENELLFRDNKTKNETVWKMISTELNKSGYNFTVNQIINKWKHLKKLYMRQKDNMGDNCSGEGTFNFNYFDLMDAIFGKSPNVTPIAIASSSKGSAIDPCILNKSVDEDADVCIRKRKSDMEKTEMVSKKQKFNNTLVTWLEQRDKERERRHEESLQLQKESMKDFKDIMTKFLDKL